MNTNVGAMRDISVHKFGDNMLQVLVFDVFKFVDQCWLLSLIWKQNNEHCIFISTKSRQGTNKGIT